MKFFQRDLITAFTLLAILTGTLTLSTGRLVAEDTPRDVLLTRIAFGACCKQDMPQPIWDAIVETSPELFLFIGDNIYGDTNDIEVLKTKWQQLADSPGYQKLKATCPVLATWDDHDYGQDDAGEEYPMKVQSQQAFLDFFEEPTDSPRRSRPGIYEAYEFGPEGKRVQILLLDTRYFRSALIKQGRQHEPGEGIRGPYDRNLDPQATILGEAQWAWLAEKLREPADVRIIVSSIQVIADGHFWEKWGNMPLERQRLFQVIHDAKANGVFFISGDRHAAELSVCDPGVGYSLLDITSSSLNKPSEWHTELNQHRVGAKFFGENFGMITIDWTVADPILRCQVRDIAGHVVLQHRTRLSELRPQGD